MSAAGHEIPSAWLWLTASVAPDALLSWPDATQVSGYCAGKTLPYCGCTPPTHVADDIVCDAPSGQLLGLDQYRPFLANFVPRVTGYDLIAALGDAETAVLVYDLHTTPVSFGLTRECFTVRDGRIARNRLIFDQTPYTAARQQSG